MKVCSKAIMKETTENIQTVSTRGALSPGLFWHFLILFAQYRTKLSIKEVMVFPNGDAYYVCPRCDMTLEREFMPYCDRCGQHLSWRGYRKAKVIYPANTKEILS